MTTATHTELMQIATKAAAYITKLNGESETFEIEGSTLTAIIDYRAEVGEDAGDRWTAPSWWMVCETAEVKACYNKEGEDDPEAAEWLRKQLN